MQTILRMFPVFLVLFLLVLCSCSNSDLLPSSSGSGGYSQVDPSDETNGTRFDPNTNSALPFQYPNSGGVKIQYDGNVSTVRYITSPSQLPEHAAFAKYDAAYFQEKALILVYESVSSGSVQVGIQSIEVESSTATVTLLHQAPSGDGTTVMATWMLWAEVDAGLEYIWTVANPALKSDHEII